MILSSADILKTLGRNEIIRLSASVSIVDGKPSLTGSEGTRIYIDRFPRVDEFQATWFIYIESDDSVELIIAELKRLLPSVRVSSGLLTTITTTDFLTESTQKAPEAPKVQATQINLTQYEERFQSLVEDVQDQMLLVSSGRAGKDGKDGLPGAPGRDGKDIDATKTELEDLANVDEGIAKEKGQVLTWDGSKWTNLYVRQVSSISGRGATSLGATSLNDLTDVSIDSELLDRDFSLVYDGSEWIVGSPPVLVEGHNRSGGTLSKGTPVYVAGTHNSGKPLLEAADADGAGTHPAIGLLHEDVADGADGHVMLSGIIANVNTSTYSAGDALYLSTTPGVLTNIRPTAATEKVQKVGIVTRVHATSGSILIIGAGRTNDINNELIALIGAGDRDAVDLGTFTGTTISDNTDIKTALQELETAVEATIEEAPQDGNYYVRQNGAWVNLSTALSATADGGNFN